MRRLLFTICYDGSNYHGWQVQPNGVTVQQKVQEALKSVASENCSVTGCSRTDAGVHANMFCFHTDTNCNIPAERFALALNSVLPDDISAVDCKEVSTDFHARYNCKGKNYVYKIYDGHIRDPFLNKFAYHHKGALNEQLMDKAAKAFVGEHDFSAFSANKSKKKSTVRYIHSFDITKSGSEIIFTITGNGFLHHMVRIMVGTLLEIGRGERERDCIPALFSSERAETGELVPACGLCLMEVTY